MDANTDLAELLARALLIEQKQAELLDGDVRYGQTTYDDEPEDLAVRVAQLEDTIFALTNSTAPGEDPVADFEAGDDDWDDELDELGVPLGGEQPVLTKAAGYGACPECGSGNADVYADGTARCEDCGWPLAETKSEGYDFDDIDLDDELDDDDFELEAKGWADDEDEDGDDPEDSEELTEMELLLARRAAL